MSDRTADAGEEHDRKRQKATMSEKQSRPKRWVLGIDIERSGGTSEYETIAIGACVVDQDFKIVASYLACAFDKDTPFERRCLKEFWVDHTDILDKIMNLTPSEDATKKMNDGFIEFVKTWEVKASEEGAIWIPCCDNSPFDAHFINAALPTDMMPFPYKFSNGKYGKFWETHSVQLGFLMGLMQSRGGRFDIVSSEACMKEAFPEMNFYDIIETMFVVPKMDHDHDHLPNNDAYTIAFEMQVMYAIQEGGLKRSGTFDYGNGRLQTYSF